MIDIIDHEFDNFFSYLSGYVWDTTKPYLAINNISEMIISYIRLYNTRFYSKRNVSDIFQRFNMKDIKTNLVLLECWLHECDNGKIKGGVYETYKIQDIQVIIDKVTESVLNLKNIPHEIDTLITDCELRCAFSKTQKNHES